jgi:hypothetical protein
MPKKFWPAGDYWFLKVSTVKVKETNGKYRSGPGQN